MKKFAKHLSLLIATVVFLGIGLMLLCACRNNIVFYSDFGAVGDGKANDFAAICQAHAYANSTGKRVRADKGATYYIGAQEKPAVIMTDTDWGDAKFIIDDSKLALDNKAAYRDIFEVQSDYTSFKKNLPEGYSLEAGQTNLGLKFETKTMVRLVNDYKKDFIRYGANQNNGSSRQEILLVDKNGNIDPSTPLLWNYENVTSMTVYPISDSQITVKGGTFVTVANKTDSTGSYFTRGINVLRSNTVVSGVRHEVTGEGNSGSPYSGFFRATYVNNVVFKNCQMTGHKTYLNAKGVSQGTYDTCATSSINVKWEKCTQLNEITDTTYWGIATSNFCKNLFMEGCSLSRFDAHQGVYNATVKNTTLGQTLSVVGWGTLTLDNVHRYALGGNGYFINLRTDYGSFWDGEVVIKNSVLTTDRKNNCVINAVWTNWNFGYVCRLPNKITLVGVKVDYVGEGDCKCYIFSQVTSDYSAKDIQNSFNPYAVTQTVVIRNEKTPFEMTLNKTGLFDNTEVKSSLDWW